MPKLIPIIFGVTGTAILGGTGAYLFSTQNTKNFKDTFKEAILDFTTDTNLITEKLTKLKADSSQPTNAKLVSAKSKEKEGANKGLEDWKSGCEEIYNSAFSKKDSDLFKDFQAFCSKNIKDAITSANWFTDSVAWPTRFGKLKVTATKPVSSTLIAIANETGDGNKGIKLKEWCEKIANAVYEGENNLEFQDAKVFCGKDN